MKKIEAVIRSNKLDQVEKALSNLGISGITVSQVLGWGRQKGNITEVYRGTEVSVRLLPKVKLEIIVNDSESESVQETIRENALTGKFGDGVIWVTAVEDFRRIRTGENFLD
ncbi:MULTISPECIES: P-II family nitrogen regulator [Dehalobacter]|jgi:nitrogen regulatory protein P-II 1|uniref:P-II family nitrogen regulator n=2 Tax=Dehalobacter restrictus TaxID=55583 RepID=A0A857DLN2_9FIRM|nr:MULTISPECIES: P-II family nitrogen regulator [Dehalobacter]AHF10668.1 nitrogen regulatory protein P-II [Dehalobacter restrictus DSM 9455]MCG1026358.1 P-II family nitrogen regulator [Dehalobacter sp.]OCZ54654.1 transcriptional regulator [Dehalobacter sp. TeCB1]QHA01295.1 P-II family nitrogen regulator [Dehalobacter restrictus]